MLWSPQTFSIRHFVMKHFCLHSLALNFCLPVSIVRLGSQVTAVSNVSNAHPVPRF
jgi:hypothetical protein